MNKLILLLTGLVCANAAPQFIFALPTEFLQQMQKPVGEVSQPGQQPRIPVFPLESLLGSSSILVECIVSGPVVPESLQAAKHLVEATPVMKVEPQQTPESAPVDVTVVPPPNAVDEVTLDLSTAQEKVSVAEEAPVEATIAEEASIVVKEAPIEETLVEEAVTDVQEVPIEAVIMEEVITYVQETPVDTPVQEVTADTTIAIQNVTPIEEMVTPSTVEEVTENLVAVEEVVVVQDVNTNTAEEVIFVEEVVITDVQETPVDTPVQEVTSDTTIAIQNATPVEEMVTPSTVEKVTENLVAVEEVVVVQDVNTNTAEEVIIVEEVIPSYNAATAQSPVATTSSPVPSITSAPVNQVVDPRMSVDPRFRNYIYVNDAPDVVAAKIALFNLQAASLPAQQVL